jgi:hypothetical protein
MSIRSFEKEIVIEAREIVGIPKIKHKDIMEWNTRKCNPTNNETEFYLPGTKVFICLLNDFIVENNKENK